MHYDFETLQYFDSSSFFVRTLKGSRIGLVMTSGTSADQVDYLVAFFTDLDAEIDIICPGSGRAFLSTTPAVRIWTSVSCMQSFESVRSFVIQSFIPR